MVNIVTYNKQVMYAYLIEIAKLILVFAIKFFVFSIRKIRRCIGKFKTVRKWRNVACLLCTSHHYVRIATGIRTLGSHCEIPEVWKIIGPDLL